LPTSFWPAAVWGRQVILFFQSSFFSIHVWSSVFAEKWLSKCRPNK